MTISRPDWPAYSIWLIIGAVSVIVKTDGSFAALGNTGGGGCREAHYSVCRDEEDQQPCSSPPADICQHDLDPTHFAPTGDIYSYFQRRRRDPFHFANPLQHSVKNRLGGRHGKYFVYWMILLSRRNKTILFQLETIYFMHLNTI